MKERTVRIVWLFVGVLLGASIVGLGALERIGAAYYQGQLTVLNQCGNAGVSMVGNYVITCGVNTLEEMNQRQDEKRHGDSL
jgi:hypothetical protein